MQFIRYTRRTLVVAGLLIAGGGAAAPDPNWRQTLADTCSAYRAEVERVVTLGWVAGKVGVPFPVPEQTRTHDEVSQEVARRVAQRVDGDTAAVDEAKLRAEAEEKYRLWREGDSVDVVDGRGRKLRGRLNTLSRSRVRIGSQWVSAADFGEDILCHVDPDESNLAISRHLQRVLGTNSARRDRLSKEAVPDLTGDVYRESGFVSVSDKWRNRQEVEQLLGQLRARLIEQQYAAGIATYLRANGFDQFGDEWLPEAVAASKLQQAREAAERRRQAHELAQQQRREAEANLEAERQATERRRNAEAEAAAEQGIPACINGLMKEQAKGEYGYAYWRDVTLAAKLFAPVEWVIVDTSVAGSVGEATVRVDSSNKGGMPIRQLWRFLMRYDGQWLVSLISEKD